ncbi:MAG TPA: hypothetical protein GXX57_07550 [Firmicutes bacterium]|nr:hypothetical protein [Bacillota bacterium]
MSHHTIALLLIVVILISAGDIVAAKILWIEAEDFEATGSWIRVTDYPSTFGEGILQGISQSNRQAEDAFTAIEIPESGRWHLWVRSRDFDTDPGRRFFSVSINGQPSTRSFGRHNVNGWAWEYGGSFHLEAGEAVLRVIDASRYWARIDCLVLTTDPQLTPPADTGSLVAVQHRVYPISQFDRSDTALRPQSQNLVKKNVLAMLENDQVRLEFVRVENGHAQWIHTDLFLNVQGTWLDVCLDPTEQGYFVLQSDTPGYFGAETGQHYPMWNRQMVTGTGESISMPTANAFAAGDGHWVLCQHLGKVDETTVRLLGEGPGFKFEADWSLNEDASDPHLTLRLLPERQRYYSVAFVGFFEKSLDEIEFLLLPYMWHSKRLPEESYMNLEAYLPTPIALVQTEVNQLPLSFALAPRQEEIPFRWARFTDSRFGLTIRGPDGEVQPALFAPPLGSPESLRTPQRVYEFNLLVIVKQAPWFTVFTELISEEYGFRDYRTNWRHSLNDAVYNMIDLLLDDYYGGWNDSGKGPYNIEMKNTVTHAAPALPLSLYRLTGDERILWERALPTIEFMLSRPGWHFTYRHEDAENPELARLQGPNQQYGTATFNSLWQLSGQLTPALWHFAFGPFGNVKHSTAYSSTPLFAEELAAYFLTDDATYLDRAAQHAKGFLTDSVYAPKKDELGMWPFFNISFVPNWVAFLDLASQTDEQWVIEGAREGANWLLTGIWTQPMSTDGKITTSVHDMLSRGMKFVWWYGDQRFRLGAPFKSTDFVAETVPAWVVSRAGLGFEQPMTFTTLDNANVLQSNWAADLVRLSNITGDPIYRIFARNAVLGRFANYPGYYVNTFSTMYQNPAYPYEGPDYTSLYYHHIYPHLAYVIDFLVAEAEYRSQNQIQFPWVRQDGYAWFSSRFYGHAPGTFYGHDGVWLWLNRDALSISDPAINYLMGHNTNQWFLMLMNEADEERTVELSWDPEILGLVEDSVRVTILDGPASGSAQIATRRGMTVHIPAKGYLALMVHDTNTKVATYQLYEETRHVQSSFVYEENYSFRMGSIFGAILQVQPGTYQAYVYATASPAITQAVVLNYYTTAGEVHRTECREFPFEFSISMDSAREFGFQLEVIDLTGNAHGSKWFTLTAPESGEPVPSK